MDTLLALSIVLLIIAAWMIFRRQNTQNRLYFDNNGTTMPHKEVVQAVAQNSYLGNASATFSTGARQVMDNCRTAIRNWLEISPQHKIIFTSGASESNNLIIRSLVDQYWRINKSKPHVIISQTEHKTSIDCCKILESDDRVDYVMIAPRIDGIIDPMAVQAAIRPNTCLISIMHANNELGSINSIGQIAKIAKLNNIPFHTDAVQTFGKYKIPMQNVSALSMSFHKMYGPPGIGVLVIDPSVEMKAQIAGSQNYSLRGGTENIPAIAGVLKTMEITLTNRKSKNNHLLAMKTYVINRLRQEFNVGNFRSYAGKPDSYRPIVSNIVQHDREVVFLGPTEPTIGSGGKLEALPSKLYTVPNTLLFSIVLYNTPESFANISDSKGRGRRFCNIELKKALDKRGVAISIGSACNATSDHPSHVLRAIRAPFIIRCGVMRISFGDHNMLEECKKMCDILVPTINEQN